MKYYICPDCGMEHFSHYERTRERRCKYCTSKEIDCLEYAEPVIANVDDLEYKMEQYGYWIPKEGAQT